MTDKYITSVQDILAGFECNARIDGNPYDGKRRGALRYYEGVRSYDIVSHDDEDALLFRVTDYHMILVVATASKLTDMCSACEAEGARYHYEDRNGRIIFRCEDKRTLFRRLLNIDWSYAGPEDDYKEEAVKANSEDESKVKAPQAALQWKKADTQARKDALVRAKSDAIAASRRRAQVKEVPVGAAAIDSSGRANVCADQNHCIDVGDLGDFE